MERDGKSNEKAVGDMVTFEGGSITIKGKDNEHKGTVKVDTSKKPKHIDLTPGDGPEMDKVMEGIFDINKDELKICLSRPGNTRPTAFESKDRNQALHRTPRIGCAKRTRAYAAIAACGTRIRVADRVPFATAGGVHRRHAGFTFSRACGR